MAVWVTAALDRDPNESPLTERKDGARESLMMGEETETEGPT